MTAGDPSPAPLPGESVSSLRTRRLIIWTTLLACTLGIGFVSYFIAGWGAVMGVAVTVALTSSVYTVPELMRIHRTLRTLRGKPSAGEGR